MNIKSKMTRCYIDPRQWPDNAETLTLCDAESQHLSRVLRARPGDLVAVFDGKGRSCSSKINSISGNIVTLNVLKNTVQYNPPPMPPVTLIQAMLKTQAMDMVLQKSVELGTSVIAPFDAERSVAKKTDKQDKTLARWNKIAINAAKQCGLDHLPEIHHPTRLEKALDLHAANSLTLVCSLAPDALPFSKTPDLTKNNKPESIAVIIGPEGDLTDEEHAVIKARAGIPVSLGPRVLRAETAAICALTLINYIFRDS